VEDEKVSRISYIAKLKGKQGGRHSLSQPALCLQPPTAGSFSFSGRKGSCDGAGFLSFPMEENLKRSKNNLGFW
jgi:hypothetical protein